MFGTLVASLDNPRTAAALIASLGMAGLEERLHQAADSAGMDPTAYLSERIRSFLDQASDEDFVQLIGVMNRAEDPGLSAVRAILQKSVPMMQGV